MSASDGFYLLLSRNRNVKVLFEQRDETSESRMAVREKYIAYIHCTTEQYNCINLMDFG